MYRLAQKAMRTALQKDSNLKQYMMNQPCLKTEAGI